MIPKECFFRQHFQVREGKKFLPLSDLSTYLSLSFRWGSDRLTFVLIESSKQPFSLSLSKENPFELSSRRYLQKNPFGDACMLFLNTRPQRKSKSMHTYCHQFLIFPEAFEGIQSKEITHFSGYESRALMKDNLISVRTDQSFRNRSLELEVPKGALYGFEEDQKELSFALRYYSKEGERVLSFPIPSLPPEKISHVWPIITLCGGV